MTVIEEKSQSSLTLSAHPEEKKAKSDTAWKNGEILVLPKNNLPIVFTSFMFCIFLPALDQVSPSPSRVPFLV